MRRMTEVLSRMISDPQTQAVLNQMDVNEDTDFSESVGESGVLSDVAETAMNITQNATPSSSSVPLLNSSEHPSPSSPQPSSSHGITSSNILPNNKRPSSNDSDMSEDDDDDDVDQNQSTSDINKKINVGLTMSDFDYMIQKYVGHRNARYVILK